MEGLVRPCFIVSSSPGLGGGPGADVKHTSLLLPPSGFILTGCDTSSLRRQEGGLTTRQPLTSFLSFSLYSPSPFQKKKNLLLVLSPVFCPPWGANPRQDRPLLVALHSSDMPQSASDLRGRSHVGHTLTPRFVFLSSSPLVSPHHSGLKKWEAMTFFNFWGELFCVDLPFLFSFLLSPTLQQTLLHASVRMKRLQ